MQPAGKRGCTSHKKRAPEEYCDGPRVRGSNPPRCRMHLGEAAGPVIAQYQAARAVRRLGFEAVEDPLRELQLLAGELRAVKNWLRDEVERLEEIRREDHRGAEHIRGELTAYQAALRDTMTALATIARLRIDERLAAISDKQADAVLRAIDAALDVAGVPTAARPAAKNAASDILVAVA